MKKSIYKILSLCGFLLLVFGLTLNHVSAMSPTASPSPTPTTKPSPTNSPVPTTAPTPTYAISGFADKTSITKSESFRVTFNVQNTGATPITNLELRVPFYANIFEAKNQTTNPSFNKLLSSNQYPAGFNSRSWIINSLAVGESRAFTLDYVVDAAPKNTTGLVSIFTLPMTWSDPLGLSNGVEHKLDYLRADIYLNDVYKSSTSVTLPKINTLDAVLSGISLSPKYIFANSKTTDLKTITKDNALAFPNFTLETTDVLVEWKAPIEFSDVNLAKLANLDTNLKIEWGNVDFNKAELGFLEKPVKITFKNTKFSAEPKVKIGTETKLVKAAGGTWSATDDKIIFNLTKLTNVNLISELMLDQNVIETSEKTFILKGKVADPASKITYKIDDGTQQFSVFNIDLQTGDFEVELTNLDTVKKIEFTAVTKTGQEDKKVVVVNYTSAVTITPTPKEKKELTAGGSLNPVTKALLLAAIALFILFGSLVYFLVYRRIKAKRTKMNPLNKDGKISLTGLSGLKFDNPNTEPKSEDQSKAKQPAENPIEEKKEDTLEKKYSLNLGDLTKEKAEKPLDEAQSKPEGTTSKDSFLKKD